MAAVGMGLSRETFTDAAKYGYARTAFEETCDIH